MFEFNYKKKTIVKILLKFYDKCTQFLGGLKIVNEFHILCM